MINKYPEVPKVIHGSNDLCTLLADCKNCDLRKVRQRNTKMVFYARYRKPYKMWVTCKDAWYYDDQIEVLD